MNTLKKTTFFFLFLFATHANGQNKEMAEKLAVRAITLEDEGKMDSVLFLLKQADSLDPNNSTINYEIGYYYLQKKDYEKAIESYNATRKLPGGKTARLYQALGNAYDLNGDSANAIKTYEEGIKEFPKAGRLYLETGNVFLSRRQYIKALGFYEDGIAAEPDYSSNYYRAAQIWTSSNYSVWGIMYGEIFINLERNSNRTATMSKWLADTYKSSISIKSKDSMKVSFYKMVIDAGNKKTLKDIKKGKLELPFGAVYEQCVLLSLINDNLQLADSLSYENMCTLRGNFIRKWYENGYDKKYPNVLFEYQHEMLEKNFFDAYNHWILSQYNDEEFNMWTKKHAVEWEKFIDWFKDHPLRINEKNRFLKSDEE